MNVAALRHAGFGGVADRARQAVARAFDRLVVSLEPRRASWPVPAHLVPEHAGFRGRDAVRGRFFAGASDDEAGGSFAARFPLARDRILFAAQSLADGRFDLLGYRGLEFGAPIVWHLDPVAGRCAPLRHWSEIDPLDFATVGDSKITWELNRHQWLVTLGQAWSLSGDARHAAAFEGAVTEWMAANPPGIGINWASSLEASMRIVSWSWALHLFRDAPRLSASLAGEMLAWIRAHALHVERYLSWYFSPNTHLTGEALGLFHAGTMFPSLDGARRWRRLGAKILVDELDRQVGADGGHFERSTAYHRYTIEIYLHFLILARRNGIALPERVATRTQQMLDWLLDVRGPATVVPALGDDDGGTWFGLAARETGDVAGVFSVAAALFGRADYADAAGGLQPETWWLLGEAGCRAFDALDPAPPMRSPSRLLRSSGHAVLRSDWSDHANHAVVDVGPLGCPVSGAHGHADLLALHLTVGGEPLVVDSGTGRYVADGWRDYFRATVAHSTVVVDHRSQAEPDGLFAWRERPAVRVRDWASDDTRDYVDAEHHGYTRLDDPVVHRRRVLFVKPGMWVVVDDLSGGAEHAADLRFQFAPGTDVVADRHSDWWQAARGAARVWLRSFSATDLAVQVDGGWVSGAYGQREPAPALSVSARAALPLRLVTVILDASDGRPAPRGGVRRRAATRETIEFAGHRVTIDDDAISHEERT